MVGWNALVFFLSYLILEYILISYIPTNKHYPSPLPPQIKKLVYVYLVRYAEEQQDVALLSISTFQKGLKDPNQLIRASALRVLSSIRVPIIAPIMMLAIKEVKCLLFALRHLNSSLLQTVDCTLYCKPCLATYHSLCAVT